MKIVKNIWEKTWEKEKLNYFFEKSEKIYWKKRGYLVILKKKIPDLSTSRKIPITKLARGFLEFFFPNRS